MFLTSEELVELTGHRTRKGQIAALTAQGIGFAVRRDGWPRTTWEAVNAALCGAKAELAVAPNWRAIDG